MKSYHVNAVLVIAYIIVGIAYQDRSVVVALCGLGAASLGYAALRDWKDARRERSWVPGPAHWEIHTYKDAAPGLHCCDRCGWDRTHPIHGKA